MLLQVWVWVPTGIRNQNRDIYASRTWCLGTLGHGFSNRDCPGQTGTFGHLVHNSEVW